MQEESKMGNYGLSKLWQASPVDPNMGRAASTQKSDHSKETSSTTAASLDYRSVQRDGFSDEDKPSSLCTEFKSTNSLVLNVQTPQRLVGNRCHINSGMEVLRLHYGDLLVDIAHPYSLVSDLLQRHVLDHSIGNAMLFDSFTRREKMIILVDAIITAIENQPASFHTLIEVLEDKPFHQTIARTLQQSYGIRSIGKEITRFTYPSAVLQYARELKALYKKLITVKGCVYNLMLRQDNFKCALDKRTILQSLAYTNLQSSLFTTHPVSFGDIFDCGSSTECILIEGDQCVGKTQLVQELCQQWDNIVRMNRFQLVLMLDLKNINVQCMEGPQQLFHHQDSSTQDELIRLVYDTKGKDVLIILDGFEQLLKTTATHGHNTFIVRIIEGKVLPKSLKLITSTPSAIPSLFTMCELTNVRHIRLLGLQGEDFEQILCPNYQEVGVGTYSLMYLPCNASVVAKLYQECVVQGDIPLTLTQFYEMHCCHLVHSANSTSSTQTPPQFFSDLHPDVHDQIMMLSKIALVEMMRGDIIPLQKKFFTYDSITLQFASIKTEDGVLKFTNQMLQSFLAAYFISQLEDHEKEQLYIGYPLSEMSSVWKFVAGLNGLTLAILDMIRSNLNDLHNIPLIVSLLYEQQDSTIVNYVLQENSMIYTLSHPNESQDLMSKCFSLGYCIATSNCTWILDFSASNLNAQALKALVNGITSSATLCGMIRTLQLDNNPLSVNEMEILSELPKEAIQYKITSLHFKSCHLKQEGFDYLAENILPAMPNLQVLDIGNNSTQKHCKLSKLFTSLAKLTELNELCLEGTPFELEDMVPLNKLLSKTDSTLTQLSIGGVNMPLDDLTLLVDTVLTQSSIESLRINGFNLTENVDTINLLETNVNLTSLIFFECKLDIAHLAASLCMNTSLKSLDIFFPLSNAKSDIDEHAAIALTDMLEVNSSLSELSLYSYKPISRRKVLRLVEILEYNYSLEVFQLPEHYSANFSSCELCTIDQRVYWKTWPCIEYSV